MLSTIFVAVPAFNLVEPVKISGPVINRISIEAGDVTCCLGTQEIATVNAPISLAIFAIALMMIVALRSLKLGLLSLIPNGLPILTTFGAWAILIGDVGFSVATVASISLGIVVDDTVHFLSKYVRAREDRQLSVEDSIRYAFDNVGMAIVINTFILAVGVGVLTSSTF